MTYKYKPIITCPLSWYGSCPRMTTFILIVKKSVHICFYFNRNVPFRFKIRKGTSQMAYIAHFG